MDFNNNILASKRARTETGLRQFQCSFPLNLLPSI